MTPQAPVVLVAGSLHYDIIVEADHLPRRDETGVGRRWYPKFGGKGGNQAVSAQMQGVPVRLFAAVGADAFGIFLRDRLDNSGVDHRHVAVCPGAGSGISVATLDAAGDYAATIVSGANLLLDPAALGEPALWSDVGLLVLQNEIPEPVNSAAAEQARRRGIPTLLNAAPCREMSAEFQRLVDILVVNTVEAEMMGTAPITSLKTAADAARMLAGRFNTVIVTAGSLGLAANSLGGAPFTIPAERVKVVSSHGAGDAFIGALAAALVRKAPFRTACATAAQAAAAHVAGQQGPVDE